MVPAQQAAAQTSAYASAIQCRAWSGCYNPCMDIFRRKQETKENGDRFSPRVRNRILLTIQHLTDEQMGSHFYEIMDDVAGKLLRKYGVLCTPPPADEITTRSVHRAVEHFFCCSEQQVFDFLDHVFRSPHYHACQEGVEAVNRVLEEEGLDYEFTPMIQHVGPPQTTGFPRGGRPITYTYPTLIRRSQKPLHQQAVKPAFELLLDPRFRTANEEMSKAHEDFRKGEYEHALTSCCAAFESVLKTICQLKGWTYDPDKDTCSVLVDICYQHQMFPSFYVQQFTSIGTIRNKMGSAHGRAQSPPPTVEREHVEHMLQTTAAHILFLVRTARV